MSIEQLLQQAAPPELPVHVEVNGAARIGDTRVTLEVILTAFEQGETPEQIVHAYPSLQLGDVCTLYAYYCRNKALFCQYLEQSRAQEQAIRQKIEAKYSTETIPQKIRQRPDTKPKPSCATKAFGEHKIKLSGAADLSTETRLEMLESLAGCIEAQPVPLEFLRREYLYDDKLSDSGH